MNDGMIKELQQSCRDDGIAFLCALVGKNKKGAYEKMRTIKQFINQANKVYFFMKDKDTCIRFYQDAEAEGKKVADLNLIYSFSEYSPTQSKESTRI